MPDSITILSVASLIGLGILAITVQTLWHGWLQLKHTELSRGRAEPETMTGMSRIELADMKERLRKLEAIADGVRY